MFLLALLEKLVHGKDTHHSSEADPSVLKDLEWSDSDSGDALVERADHLERTTAPVAHA
jgi:hypothetical protein